MPGVANHQSTENSQSPHVTNGREPSAMTVADAWRLLQEQVRELKEYLLYYVSAKSDKVKIRLRNTVLWIVISALGFMTFVGFLITAGWFALNGIAGGVGVLCGDRLWLGNLVTGVLTLLGLGLGIYCTAVNQMRVSRNRTIQKYEERQARQKSEFGHNVCDQAARTANGGK